MLKEMLITHSVEIAREGYMGEAGEVKKGSQTDYKRCNKT